MQVNRYSQAQQLSTARAIQTEDEGDPKLKELKALELTPEEAQKVLAALDNTNAVAAALSDTNAKIAYQILFALKDEHRSLFMHCGPTKRYQVAVAYLNLVAEHDYGGIIHATGHGIFALCDRRKYVMKHVVKFFTTENLERGESYVGRMVNDQPQGRGNKTFQNGSVYEGEFKNGKIHGQGIFRLANGDIFKCTFDNGKASGSGTVEYQNGEVYTGAFKNGQADGNGILFLISGNKYTGEFANDEPHGNGTLDFVSGVKYRGEFKSGQADGNGTIDYPSGSKYVGVFHGNFLRNGAGIYTTASAKSYYVEFLNDRCANIEKALAQNVLDSDSQTSRKDLNDYLDSWLKPGARRNMVSEHINYCLALIKQHQTDLNDLKLPVPAYDTTSMESITKGKVIIFKNDLKKPFLEILPTSYFIASMIASITPLLAGVIEHSGAPILRLEISAANQALKAEELNSSAVLQAINQQDYNTSVV